jgi:hypothetical protein
MTQACALKFTALVFAVGLSACVAPVRHVHPSSQPVYARPVTQAPQTYADETDLVPPVPTFESVYECELAYGPGACGSGSQIYAAASLDAPGNAANWYMPFAFGAMTGVLVNRYYAPPARYVATVPYKTYLSPVVVQQYRVVTPRVIEVYHRAPLSVRSESHLHGPVRFAPSQGIVTSRPHAPQPAQIVMPARTFNAPTPAMHNNIAPAPQRFAAPMPSAQRLVAPTAMPTPPVQVQRAPAPVIHTMPAPAQPIQRAPAPPPAPAKKACNGNLPKSATNCS